jgi:hypothetical protein
VKKVVNLLEIIPDAKARELELSLPKASPQEPKPAANGG